MPRPNEDVGPGILPADVERLRVVVEISVAVRRTEGNEYLGSGRDLVASDLGIPGCDTSPTGLR